MPISLAQQASLVCPRCAHSIEAAEWVAIDLVERPDLRPVLASGEWLSSGCDRCGERIDRTAPLVVTRLSPIASLLLALSYERLLAAGDPLEDSRALLDGVRTRMGSELRHVPGPLLLLPFDVLALAAARDIAADATDIRSMVAEIAQVDRALAENYATFLEVVNASGADRRLGHALNRLRAADSLNELRRLFYDNPELRTEEAHADLARRVHQAVKEEDRLIAQSQLAVLEQCVAGDFEGAWETMQQALLNLTTNYFIPRLKELYDSLNQHIECQEWQEAPAVAEELLQLCGGAESEHIEAPVSVRAATALQQMGGEGRAERLERAISLLSRAVEIYDARPDLGNRLVRVQALQNLGAAYGERLLGDPVANQERAIALQREALDLTTIDDGFEWALSQTNLGLGLLERARARHTREFDWEEESNEDAEAEAEIEEAIRHFHEALEWRSFERDPADWAYTQINLGLAYSRRRGGEQEKNLRLALDHYGEAARGFKASGDIALQGQVLHNIAGVTLRVALLDSTPDSERRLLTMEAADHARASLEIRSLRDAPHQAGMTWHRLGECLLALDDHVGAAAAFQAALQGLTPETAPRETRDVARALARLALDAEDWAAAARAWEVAAEAGAQAWETRATAAGRALELQQNLNIFRWAGYALTRAGRPERAVEVLELGRARQLATWIANDVLDLRRLRDLDPDLEQRYRELREALELLERDQRDGVNPSAAEAARIVEDLSATVAAIRLLPGFATFLARPRFPEIAAAVRPGDALAYLVTSPSGSLALMVTNAEPGARVQAIEAAALTSTDLSALFLNPDIENETLSGYLIAHEGSSAELTEAIEAFSPTLGAQLLAPLRAAAAELGVTTLCLIPIGLLGLLPLHALSWEEGGQRRCLLDDFTVVFSPSAFVRSVCVRRAAVPTDQARGLVIGNPLPQSSPLPGAEFEATLVADALPVPALDLLVGTDATKEEVLARLPGATYVHFACHGSASILGASMEAALYLAGDEPLLAKEILELGGFRPQLVVASACETGIIQGDFAADEALTLGMMFLAAGATGVVSTLWAIDDFATALLMSRFYELVRDTEDQAPALRAAQLWLRSLTAEEEDRYLAMRPALRARRTEPDGGDARPAAPPYDDITIWGAFVSSGA